MQAYPFDHRIVSVKFRHSDMIRSKLIFIPDTLGLLPQTGTDKRIPGRQLNVPGWRIKDSNCYQQIVRRALPNGQQAEYSQFAASVRAERKGAGVAVKIFFPIFVILILLYFIYTVPADQIIVRIMICIAGIISGSIAHLSVLYKVGLLPSAVGYIFFVIYGLSAIGGIIASGMYVLHRRNRMNRIRLLNRIGKIIHVSAMILAGIFIGILYHGLYRGL
ncbi:MAG: hypothetical protein HC887_01755 [Desulfobacteraceae bacterium]|nr:hypothetical protein [Desulfobacteraceae bacterium]